MNENTPKQFLGDENYKWFFYESPFAIEISDVNGNLIEANKAYLDLFGVVGGIDQLRRINFFDYLDIPADSKEKLLRGESVSYEREFDFAKVKEQSRYETSRLGTMHLHVIIKPMGLNGKKAATGLLVHVQDVSELKRTGETLKKRMNDVELYLNIITHDLNNYLQTSRGYHEIFMEHLVSFPELAGAFQHSLAGITNATTLLSNISILMKTILPVSYDFQPIDVLLTIIKVHKKLLELFPHKRIELQTENIMPSDSVLADILFEQMMLNLLINAVKFDERELVKIKISARDSIDSKHYVLAITDQGKGIPPEQRKEVFEKYNEFRKKGTGSGLGLFIVKNLIERYKGRIWIESRLPEDYKSGTTFVIELKKI
ncbi:MAG: ATP-binding protein [Candidatus Odinarchaeota archaeon]